MKLGVLGGSFNPIHNGHLAMANAARRAHGLDLVLFVPAGRPPHKGADLAPAEDRYRMVALAVEGLEGFAASDIETSRPGVSYTVETLAELRRLHPGAEIFFVIGEDSIPEFPGWREPERILELARVVAVNRPGHRSSFGEEYLRGVPPERIEQLERDRVTMEPCPLQSRSLRDAVRRGCSLAGSVPPPVAEYIERHGLYRR
jgi:nicotinate-nucleotide adenylyltransferase